LETNDTEAAASFFKNSPRSAPRRVEQLREDFNGFFYLPAPECVIHLRRGAEEV